MFHLRIHIFSDILCFQLLVNFSFIFLLSAVRFKAVIHLTPTSNATVNIIMRIPVSLISLLKTFVEATKSINGKPLSIYDVLFPSSDALPSNVMTLVVQLIGYFITVIGALGYAFSSRLDTIQPSPRFRPSSPPKSETDEVSS